VHWTIEEGKRAKDGVTVRLSAKIEDGWHLYALKLPPDGPIPTRIWIPEDQPFKVVGEIRAPKPHTTFDSNFNMDVSYYEGSADFEVPVKPATTARQTLHIKTSYQSCNDRLCLPPKTVTLDIDIDPKK
jgi:thiol:disulfide interchange protein DsbD